jgi:hypothetical protein
VREHGALAVGKPYRQRRPKRPWLRSKIAPTFSSKSGLVILGKIDSGIEAFNVPGSVKVAIELLK